MALRVTIPPKGTVVRRNYGLGTHAWVRSTSGGETLDEGVWRVIKSAQVLLRDQKLSPAMRRSMVSHIWNMKRTYLPAVFGRQVYRAEAAEWLTRELALGPTDRRDLRRSFVDTYSATEWTEYVLPISRQLGFNTGPSIWSLPQEHPWSTPIA